MKFGKKISVIIPVYNTEKYIDRCLKSVLSNTYQNIEVICIDDGSTDLSYDILKSYAEKDKRIKVIKQENAGVSAARNTGLNAMTGDFVTFVDSDDWIHPKYFETMLYFQEKTNAAVVCCTWENVTDEAIENLDFEKKDIEIELFEDLDEILNNNVTKRQVCGHLYLAEIVRNHYFETDLGYGEDTFFNISLVCQTPNMAMVIVKKELYFYYTRLSSACYTTDWTKKIYLPQKYLEYLEKKSDESVKIYLIEACKAILGFRYGESFSLEYKKIKAECSPMIACCKKKMKQIRGIGLKKRVIYNVFFDFPFVYRMFRIVSDRTLLDWEKRQREQRKKLHE